jgi:hypothetical protein
MANKENLYHLLSLLDTQKNEMLLLQQHQPSILQAQLNNLMEIRSRKLSLAAELDRLQNLSLLLGNNSNSSSYK